MGAAIGPQKDFSAEALRAMARRTKDGPLARRLLALPAIYDGATRGEAAKIGGVTLQIVRDWVLRFNADGPNGLVDRKAPGQPSLLKDEHRAALAHMVEDGPTPAIHGVVRWRIVDLCQWLFEEFRISVSETTMSRELRAMLDAARYRARSNLYTVAVRDSRTNIPLAADEGSRRRDHSHRAAF